MAGDPAAPVVSFVAKQQLLFKEIERLMKKFKTHRCVLDFDSGYVKRSLIDLTLQSVHCRSKCSHEKQCR